MHPARQSLRLLVALLLCLCLSGAASAESPLLVIISAASPAAADYVPADLTPVTARRNDLDGNNANGGVYVSATGTVQLCAPAAEALTAMFAAAEKDGVVLYLRQGYRSFAEEERRYARMKDQPDAVRPGESDYQTGLAVTVVGVDWRAKSPDEAYAASAEYAWVKAHAAEYGFVERFPQGKEAATGCAWAPWHLRYVGDAAGEIAASGLALEEYVASAPAAESAESTPPEDPVDSEDPTVPEDPVDADEPIVPESTPAATPAPAKPALPVVSPEDYAAGRLPAGPVVLDVETSDGDTEIILFHD